MKKFIRHFVSFFLVAVMIVSSNITAFAANEKPVDSRFLPEITYTEDNTSTTRVPNLIPITVNPYYNKLVVHVGNLGVDSIDSVTWKETQAKSNVFSILLAFQTLSSRQLNNRGFPLVILKKSNKLCSHLVVPFAALEKNGIIPVSKLRIVPKSVPVF